MDAVEVIAKWDRDGMPYPIYFWWQGEKYLITQTGRRWSDSEGEHMLCAVEDGQVFELIFSADKGWQLGEKTTGVRFV